VPNYEFKLKYPFLIYNMLILSLLAFVFSQRVKIASKRNPAYFLTILNHGKGDFVRLMKESDIHNPAELSGFEVSGDTTELNNNGVSVCENGWKTDIITCLRNSGEKTVFNVIKTAKGVVFKTKDGNCLTMGNLDPITNGYHLKSYSCRNDDSKQQFILMNMNNANEPKTPPALFPNSVNNNHQTDSSTNATNGKATPGPLPNNVNNNNHLDSSINATNGKATPAGLPNNVNNNNHQTDSFTNTTTGNATPAGLPHNVNNNNHFDSSTNATNGKATPGPMPNGVNGTPTPATMSNGVNYSSQNNGNGTSLNTNMPNILFIPISLDQNYASEFLNGSQLNNNLNPLCFDTNLSAPPTSFNNVYKFRRPAQLGNECNNHLQWTYTFRRLY
jgi:hypothetical protein